MNQFNIKLPPRVSDYVLQLHAHKQSFAFKLENWKRQTYNQKYIY